MLGELKFAFPNKHDVYMHDTPTKNLFERGEPRRSATAACACAIPRRMAEILLAEDKGWDAAKIADLIANGPREQRGADRPQDRRAHHLLHGLGRRQGRDCRSRATSTGTRSASRRRSRAHWGQIAKGPNHLAPVRTPESLSYASGSGMKSINDFFTNVLGGGF